MSSKLIRSPETQKSKRRKAEGGFTLLEVVVALAIMAVGFVTVLQMFSGGVKSVDLSDQYLRAITLAGSKLSELEIKNFETEKLSGIFENEERFRWEVNITPYESDLNEEGSDPLLSKINLTVLWEDVGKTRKVELATIQLNGTTNPIPDNLLASIFSGGAGTIAQDQGPTPDSPTQTPATSASSISGAPTPFSSTPNISGAP